MYLPFFAGIFFILFMLLIIYPVTTNKATFIEPLDKTETQIYVDGVKNGNEDISNNDENNIMSYNLDNLNVTYHPTPEELEKDFGYGLGFDTTVVFDPSNNELKTIKMPNNQTYPLYNEPGKLKYGNKKFVPTYEESILLSSQTNKNVAKSPKNDSSNYNPYINEIKMGKYEE
tara:strand:- start:28295 stop:28813 length:519 start_codon:yes stop_codon:yes gene_type:complete